MSELRELFKQDKNRERVRRLNAERVAFNEIGDNVVGVVIRHKLVLDKTDGTTFSVYTLLTPDGDKEVACSGMLEGLLDKAIKFSDLVYIEFTDLKPTGKKEPMKEYFVEVLPLTAGMLPTEMEQRLADAKVNARQV